MVSEKQRLVRAVSIERFQIISALEDNPNWIPEPAGSDSRDWVRMF